MSEDGSTLCRHINWQSSAPARLVSQLRFAPNGIEVQTNCGLFVVSAVILACGMGLVQPRKLGLEGEHALELRKLFYSVDQPDDWVGLNVAVAGGGDSAAEQQRQLLTPRLVLNHARNDVLAPRVKGKGTEWQVSASAEAEMKTRTVEWILNTLPSPEHLIWVNAYTGKHGATKQSFCPGRYSLAGLEHALRSEGIVLAPLLEVGFDGVFPHRDIDLS